MAAAKNVLLIVVDQWRGLMLPKLGADYLKLPNLDKMLDWRLGFAERTLTGYRATPKGLEVRAA